MRSVQNNRRNRGRNSRKSNSSIPSRNQVYDSSGPEVRVRGNALQIYEKYQSLGRDAASNGNRVKAEACYQYAEHYLRLHNLAVSAQEREMNERQKRNNERNNQRRQPQENQEQQAQSAYDAQSSEAEPNTEAQETQNNNQRQQRKPRFERPERKVHRHNDEANKAATASDLGEQTSASVEFKSAVPNNHSADLQEEDAEQPDVKLSMFDFAKDDDYTTKSLASIEGKNKPRAEQKTLVQAPVKQSDTEQSPQKSVAEEPVVPKRRVGRPRKVVQKQQETSANAQ